MERNFAGTKFTAINFPKKIKFVEYANVKKSAKNAMKKVNDEIIQQSKEAIAKADMALQEWLLM